jgi:hypothetical protein
VLRAIYRGSRCVHPSVQVEQTEMVCSALVNGFWRFSVEQVWGLVSVLGNRVRVNGLGRFSVEQADTHE